MDNDYYDDSTSYWSSELYSDEEEIFQPAKQTKIENEENSDDENNYDKITLENFKNKSRGNYEGIGKTNSFSEKISLNLSIYKTNFDILKSLRHYQHLTINIANDPKLHRNAEKIIGKYSEILFSLKIFKFGG